MENKKAISRYIECRWEGPIFSNKYLQEENRITTDKAIIDTTFLEPMKIRIHRSWK